MLEADETIMRMCKDPAAGYCLFVQILDSAAPQTLLRDNVSEISKKKTANIHRHLQRGGHSLSDFGLKNTDKSV